MSREEILYCDHCGVAVWTSTKGSLVAHRDYTSVPFNILSANKGESATVCLPCISGREDEEEAAREADGL
jgi:hypothetical protein